LCGKLKVQAAAGEFSFAPFQIHLNPSQQMENVFAVCCKFTAIGKGNFWGAGSYILGPASLITTVIFQRPLADSVL